MASNRERMKEKAISLLGDGYVYGATGWICTRERLKQQAEQYPQYADLIYRYGPQWLGKPCYDCAQLTRTVAKAAGISLPSGSNSQWNARGVWAERGKIADMPDEAGLFLYTVRDGGATHTGVSIGGGEEIDARGHAYGVVRRRIADASFTHYARLAVDYEHDDSAQQETAQRQTLRNGSRGEDVRSLQQKLIALGYDLAPYGADGYFGAKTAEAVQAFQLASGLTADGIVGKQTWTALDTAKEPDEQICVDASLLRALLPALEDAQEEGEEVRILLGADAYGWLMNRLLAIKS